MGEGGDRGSTIRRENEFSPLRLATLTLGSKSPADGPSSSWLSRHFPWYQLEEEAEQLQTLAISSLFPTTACGHVHTPAQTSRTGKRASAITIGYALLTATLLIPLVHANQICQLRQPAHRCRLSDFQPQSPLYAPPIVAIGHHRCPSFRRIHDASPGPYFTSTATTFLQPEQHSRHQLQIFVVDALMAVPQPHGCHTSTTVVSGIREISDFTPAILHQKIFGLFRALRELLNSAGRRDTAMLLPQGAHCRTSTHPLAAARSLLGQ